MESHLHVMLKTHPTAIIGVPSFMRKLALHIRDAGMDPRRMGIRRLIGIGEPLRDASMRFLKLGRDLETLWGARAYSTYASSETITSFQECTAQRGGHLHPDLAIVEIADENGRILGEGEQGEVVVTPLAIEGMPLIRFRTGDVSFLLGGPCPCGRRSVRLGPIIGRKKQMMKVRGTTLYPQAVYSELDRFPGIAEYYVAVSSSDSLSDELTVHAAVKDPRCTAEAIGNRLQARLRVRPRVVIEPEELIREKVFTPRSRKPVRFVDTRKNS
jgi:phenylacetate-CoA ligase